MWNYVQGTWVAGLRSRAFFAIAVLGMLLMVAAFLAGFFSPRQPQTVALDVGLSGLRFALVLLNLFWVQELVAREIDRRTVVWALSFPLPRSHYLLGRYLGITCLSALAAIAMGLMLVVAAVLAGGGYAQEFPVRLGIPYWATLLGLIVDVAVVLAFSLWISTLSTVPMLPLALGAAFAIAGKSLGPVLEFFARGADGDSEMNSTIGPAIAVIRWLLPDLSRLDWRDWPLYGLSPSTAEGLAATAMSAGYLALMLGLAVAAFGRRQFQ